MAGAESDGSGPDFLTAGLVTGESMTPRKTAARVVRLGELQGEPADSVHRVARAVEEVLYAHRPVPAAGLAEEAARVRAGPRGADRRARLRAVLAPRSAVSRWAASARWSAVTTVWAERRQALVSRTASLLRRTPREAG
ncbi:transglutaminase [Streptomyces narbonensis]